MNKTSGQQLGKPVSSPVVVALDRPDQASALALADRLDSAHCRVKVGKELFTAAGPAVVTALRERGFEVFLDLKFHDIPNTVAAAVSVAADLGVWMVNVHASGGRRMLTAAAEVLAGRQSRPLLTAVTVLTSMSAEDLSEVRGVETDPEAEVRRLAALAASSGLDGVVCSAREAPVLRDDFAQGAFCLVTPGIRPAGSAANDQTRIVTPADALAMGSDYLVIGRPITAAEDPAQALAAINAGISG